MNPRALIPCEELRAEAMRKQKLYQIEGLMESLELLFGQQPILLPTHNIVRTPRIKRSINELWLYEWIICYWTLIDDCTDIEIVTYVVRL